MKVGTDGVLLGAWAHVPSQGSVLDIGTGTGLIALMLAQRSKARIDAVELDEAACFEAIKNVNLSPWPENIRIHQASFQEFGAKNATSYDLIVSNPPFFNRSLKALTGQRTKARHTDTLSCQELFSGVQKLLTLQGKFEVIIPVENLPEYRNEAEKNQLFLNQVLWVKPTPDKPAKRVLCSFSKTKKVFVEETLVVESGGRHVYSEKYTRLTKDFYLGF